MVTGEEPVLTADDDIFLCSLTTVIVYFDAAVLEICPHGVNVAKYMHGGLRSISHTFYYVIVLLLIQRVFELPFLTIKIVRLTLFPR